MHRGYVKLWRKSLESSIWDNHNLFRFWVWCLMKATHKEITEIVGYQEVELKPGQFVFGRHKAARECGLSEQCVRTCLLALINLKNITSKSTNKYSIITILNWDIYQQTAKDINQQDNQEITNNQPATNQQLTTNKNAKNAKHNKNKRESVEIPPWIDPEIWADFKEFRIRKKAPLTNRAIKDTIIDLEKLSNQGHDPNSVLRQSIKRGWTGVFPIKDNSQPNRTKAPTWSDEEWAKRVK